MDERARSEAAIRDADDALRESYAQVQDLAGRLISAQEGERTRIARDLHDDVGQQLAAVAIGLSRVRQHLPAGASQTVVEIASLQEGVDEIARALRDLSHELHPAALRHLGLGVALKGHCREFAERYGIEVDFRAEGDLRAVTPAIALCTFRVAQEALRNVGQHARTRAVRVRLTGADGALRLTIGDDGRGFDRDLAAVLPGLGLVSMDERVRAVGGRLTIDTQPGAGTTVAIDVPIGDSPHGAPDSPPRG
jgi:signal transduction histidine kinase